jgi:BirA family biotin operon repressor/biotin-[acetyl-CoA-carboxylase] ligase
MPDRSPVDVEAVRAAIGSRWARVVAVAETTSTNTDLLNDSAAPDRAVLLAEHQVAGRGRLDRTWSSPPGAGLTFSVLLRPQVPIPRWGWLPLLTGLALQEAVAATGLLVGLKWPNDLLAGHLPESRKVAGILAQTSGDAVVVGIGLNVSTAADELPVESATSLLLAGGQQLDRTRLLAAILARLDSRYSQWVDFDGDAEACGLAAAYRAACLTLGQRVVVTGAGDAVTGRAVGIDSAGRLVVVTDDGEQAIGAGDVEHLRPA